MNAPWEITEAGYIERRVAQQPMPPKEAKRRWAGVGRRAQLLWLHGAGREFSEVDTEAYAFYTLRRYRKEFAR